MPSERRARQEQRRLRAWELHQAGWAQHDIAAALGVTRGAVSQWLRLAREGGPEALRRRPPPGRPPRLSAAQRQQVAAWLTQRARAFGFPTDRWSGPRLAALIEQRFGVRYHPAHIGRLLRPRGERRNKKEVT